MPALSPCHGILASDQGRMEEKDAKLLIIVAQLTTKRSQVRRVLCRIGKIGTAG